MTYLYRHFDDEGVLLYVGVSLSFTKRTKQHKENSHWFENIKKIEIQKYETRKEAIEAEKKAIIDEKPIYNLKKPSLSEVKEVEKREESKGDLVKRVVQFNPTYSVSDVANLLGTGIKAVKSWLEEGELGYIIIGYTSHRWGRTPKIRITGWQIIDFIEYLETKTKEETNNKVDPQK